MKYENSLFKYQVRPRLETQKEPQSRFQIKARNRSFYSNLLSSSPFILMHLAVGTAFLVPFHWTFVWICLGSYLIRMFAITAGYHRYFSHRSYKTSRLFQFALA